MLLFEECKFLREETERYEVLEQNLKIRLKRQKMEIQHLKDEGKWFIFL